MGQAVETNKKLREKLERLSDVEIRANELAMRIARYETILNVESGAGIPVQKISARAVAENDGPFVFSALINAGHKKGVRPGNAVMTSKGLYGHVLRAGKRSARVLRLEDLNSRIAVMSQRSEARAILQGRNSDKPKLTFVNSGADWRDGDIVITSGDDGIMPLGLPIGVVENVEKDEPLTVKLYAQQTPVDWVYVYPFDPIAPPEVEEENESVDTVSEEAGE